MTTEDGIYPMPVQTKMMLVVTFTSAFLLAESYTVTCGRKRYFLSKWHFRVVCCCCCCNTKVIPALCSLGSVAILESLVPGTNRHSCPRSKRVISALLKIKFWDQSNQTLMSPMTFFWRAVHCSGLAHSCLGLGHNEVTIE